MVPRGDVRGKDGVGTCGTGAPFEYRWILGCKPNTSSASTCPELDSRVFKGSFRVTVGHGATGNKA